MFHNWFKYILYCSLGKCEFCGYIGIKESFFSKSKRFCKMECAKRYSASNIKKKSKGDKIGTPKKKHRPSASAADTGNTGSGISSSASTNKAPVASLPSSVPEVSYMYNIHVLVHQLIIN